MAVLGAENSILLIAANDKGLTMKIALLATLLIFSHCQSMAMRIEPHYPQAALDQCLDGYVVLKFKIVSGGVEILEVTESNPPGIFDEAAIKNLKLQSGVYVRKYKDGETATEKFTFKIEDECAPKI